VKSDIWYPVWATIEARERRVVGDLVLTQEKNSLRVAIPVDVAKGSKKRYAAAFKFTNQLSPKLNVALEAKDLEPIAFPVAFRPAEAGAQHILVIAEQTGGFGFLNRAEPDRLRATDRPSIPERMVLYGRVELLPDDPILLEPLDALILNGPQARSLTAAQWAAIETWVRFGGRLMIGAGPYCEFIQNSPAKNPFGISLEREPEPARWGGADLLAAWPAAPPQGWEKIWLGDAQRPFLATARSGRGRVTVCAAALGADVLKAINGSPDAEWLWARVVERRYAASWLQQMADEDEFSFGALLQTAFDTGLVSARWVMIYLGGYILAALPLAWIICGRLKRRGLFWLVAVSLSIGFTAYTYLTGSLSKVRGLCLSEITFINRSGAEGPTRATTLSSVYSPRRFNRDFTPNGRVLPSPPSLPGPATGQGNPGFRGTGAGDLYANTPFTLALASPPALRGFSVYPYSARNLRTDFMAEVPGAIEIEVPLHVDEHDRIQGRIHNATPWDFDQTWITNGHSWWSGPGLARGAASDLGMAFSRNSGADISGLENLLIPSLTDHILGESLNMLSPSARQLRYPATWDWAQGRDTLDSPQDGWTFVGQVAQSISPLLEGMASASPRRQLLYEQDLPIPPIEDALAWRVMLPRAGNYTSPYLQHDLQGRPLNQVWLLAYRTGEGIVQFIPSRGVLSNPGDALSLRCELKSNPDGQNLIREMGASPNTITNVRFLGLPVDLYNLRTKKWEPQGLWDGTALIRLSARDYVDPVTSVITLRYHVRQVDLAFKVTYRGGRLETTESGQFARNDRRQQIQFQVSVANPRVEFIPEPVAAVAEYGR